MEVAVTGTVYISCIIVEMATTGTIFGIVTTVVDITGTLYSIDPKLELDITALDTVVFPRWRRSLLAL